jgi:hypothetical protein
MATLPSGVAASATSTASAVASSAALVLISVAQSRVRGLAWLSVIPAVHTPPLELLPVILVRRCLDDTSGDPWIDVLQRVHWVAEPDLDDGKIWTHSSDFLTLRSGSQNQGLASFFEDIFLTGMNVIYSYTVYTSI